MLETHIIEDRHQWNETLRYLPYAHVLQSWEWGEIKQQTTGWQAQRLAFKRGGETVAMASIGMRQAGPFKVFYAPKGPALRYEDHALTDDILDYLQDYAQRQRAVWLKIDPDLRAGTGIPNLDNTPYLPGQSLMQTLEQRGWRFSDDQVQFRNTITLDLTLDEASLLAQMSGNTRRKIRTATKKGVSVRPGNLDDLSTLYELYARTGERNAFMTRPFSYYQQVWRTMIDAGLAQPFLAEFNGQAIAHVILFHFGQTAWYFYGASADEERQRMPNYALQWEAIRWAKARGYRVYDMWGAPDEFHEGDPLWGVYEFKRGFRGTITRHIGAWDYAPLPWLYSAYTRAWPRLRDMMRKRP